MIKNYLKITIRSLMKNKFISFINLFGLTIGLSCCLLILIYLLHETSYDQYNKNAANIYRVERTFLNAETGATSLKLGAIAPPFAPLLQNDFKDIRKTTQILSVGDAALKYNNQLFTQENLSFADENLLSIFDFKLLKGDANTALKHPFSLMLTQEVAEKFFGKQDPINKVIRFNNQLDFKVTGVYEALPSNAHWHPEVLLSFSTLNDPDIYGADNLKTNWGNNSFYTYLLMPPHYDISKLTAQLPAFQNRHIPSGGKYKATDWSQLSIRKMTDIHLHAHTDSELDINGDINRVYIFSAIAFFILLIACINYMNLSSARSALRAKEIGVRKVTGALKSELIIQFLSESVLLSWMAALCTLAVTLFSLPWLNQITGLDLSLNSLLTWNILPIILLVPFITGILSGIYPALYLASFRPVMVLKGVINTGNKGISLRKALVVFQFTISIILIIATIIVFQQLDYVQNKSLGFDKHQVLTFDSNDGLGNQFDAFKSELLANAHISQVGRSSRIPSGRLLDAQGSTLMDGNSAAPVQADIKYVTTDEDFLATYGIKMLAGRNLSKAYVTDTASFLLNESAVKALGIQSNEQIIGKAFHYGDRKGTVIGVFQDFNFESLHQRILPLVFYKSIDGGYNRISVKIKGNIPASLQHIESTWKKFLPEIPFQSRFLDERYTRLYEEEQRQSSIFTVFSGIAIFIACLGLLGLSAFSINQRVKEIGIRKVLGASIANIIGLISQDFLKLVIIAALIAFPIAWFAMNKWLNDFAYRISPGWWVFLLAAALALFIALITISFQAIKAALANPVKSLRCE
jgi:putative ABC transport system permease protein